MKAEVGKLYRHYKNQKTYKIIGIALHSETLEELVIYEGQYEDRELGKHPLFARPRDMFEEEVEHNGTKVDRFLRIE
jgi:hypothetical protein